MLQIQRLEGRRGIKRFVAAPWRILDGRAYPQWIPPLRMSTAAVLDPRKNPLFRYADQALFLATRHGRPVGRVAALHNRLLMEERGEAVGLFGFFECVDDGEVARALLDAAGAWLKERGCTRVEGPWHPTSNYDGGLLVDGFEHPQTFFTSWNPRYYPELVEGCGYAKGKDLLAWHLKLDGTLDALHARLEALSRRASARLGVRFGPLDVSDFDAAMDRALAVYRRSWGGNWGFCPLQEAEWRFIAHELKEVMIPEGMVQATADGELVGFGLFIPDYNRAMEADRSGRLLPFNWLRILRARRRTRWVRNMLAGVLPEYQRAGVLPMLLFEAVRRASDFGVTDVEISWVLEDNEGANLALKQVGAVPYRTWRIYQKAL